MITEYIELLRAQQNSHDDLCADLLEMHASTSLSLDNWESAKIVIQSRLIDLGIDKPVIPNNGA